MPRLMSVSMTKDAVIARTKTVTRRKGWWLDKSGKPIVKVGDRLTLVEKAMGLKKGEQVVRLAEVEIVSVDREPLSNLIPVLDLWPPGLIPTVRQYAAEEMAREGFPGLDPIEFVRRYFTEAQGIPRTAEVTRIEWRYLDEVSS